MNCAYPDSYDGLRNGVRPRGFQAPKKGLPEFQCPVCRVLVCGGKGGMLACQDSLFLPIFRLCDRVFKMRLMKRFKSEVEMCRVEERDDWKMHPEGLIESALGLYVDFSVFGPRGSPYEGGVFPLRVWLDVQVVFGVLCLVLFFFIFFVFLLQRVAFRPVEFLCPIFHPFVHGGPNGTGLCMNEFDFCDRKSQNQAVTLKAVMVDIFSKIFLNPTGDIAKHYEKRYASRNSLWKPLVCWSDQMRDTVLRSPARNAALTVMCINKRHAKGCLLGSLPKDVAKIIAKLIYQSRDTFDW